MIHVVKYGNPNLSALFMCESFIIRRGLNAVSGDSHDVCVCSVAYSEMQSDDRQSVSPQLMASSPDQMQAKVSETGNKQQVSQFNSGSRATAVMTTAPSDSVPRVFSADSLRAG